MVAPAQDYRSGQLLTGELKAKCIKVLQEFVKNFQEVRPMSVLVYCTRADSAYPQSRAKITEEQINAFMDGSRQIIPTYGKSTAAAAETPSA